jgi:hypothetical protein
MKKFNFLVITFLSGSLLYGEQAGQESTEEKSIPGVFFLTMSESILSNTLLYLADRYIAKETWTWTSPASIRENLTGPVSVAEQSKTCTVFAQTEAGIVGSNPTQSMDAWFVCVYSVFVLSCV